MRAATVVTAVNGFAKTGIWPVDRDVFSEWDFAAAAPTDIQLPLSDEGNDAVVHGAEVVIDTTAATARPDEPDDAIMRDDAPKITEVSLIPMFFVVC